MRKLGCTCLKWLMTSVKNQYISSQTLNRADPCILLTPMGKKENLKLPEKQQRTVYI